MTHARQPRAALDARDRLNAAARHAFGDLRGRPFVSVVAPEHVAVVERERQRMLDGAPVTDYEVDVLTVDGRRHAQISSVPIECGDACHAVCQLDRHEPRNPVGAIRLDHEMGHPSGMSVALKSRGTKIRHRAATAS